MASTPCRRCRQQGGGEGRFGAANPRGQLATPADIAQVVVALIAGESDLPTGEAVLVDRGGVTSQIRPMSFGKP